jgi:hypothetical protein
MDINIKVLPVLDKTLWKNYKKDSPLRSSYENQKDTKRPVNFCLNCMGIIKNPLTLFPDGQKFNVFLAMAYYNVGEYSKAMELLLNSLVKTSRGEGILRYQRAIHFYSDKLNQTW